MVWSVPNHHSVPKIHRSILNESEKSADSNQIARQKSATHGPASKAMKPVNESEHSLYRKKLEKSSLSTSTISSPTLSHVASTENDSGVDDIKDDASVYTQTTSFTKLVS